MSDHNPTTIIFPANPVTDQLQNLSGGWCNCAANIACAQREAVKADRERIATQFTERAIECFDRASRMGPDWEKWEAEARVWRQAAEVVGGTRD